jgi:hypothetical protein
VIQAQLASYRLNALIGDDTNLLEACDDGVTGDKMHEREDQKTDENKRRGGQEGTSDQISSHANLLSSYRSNQVYSLEWAPQPCWNIYSSCVTQLRTYGLGNSAK